jgi:hypothetical protein
MSRRLELSADRTVAFEPAEESPAERESASGTAATLLRGANVKGPVDRAILWTGCVSRHRCGVCARASTKRFSGVSSTKGCRCSGLQRRVQLVLVLLMPAVGK